MFARTLVVPVGIMAVAAAGTVFAAGATVPTLAPTGLHPGQRAVVRTVFVGALIDSFEAEIVGVLAGGKAEGDMILARATSPRVVQSGVAQGMSGSPVYVDGRLIGALSSGWAYSKEPLFGITPIGEMLAVLDLPRRPAGESSSGPSGLDARGSRAALSCGPLRWSDPVEAPGLEVAPVLPAGLAPLALPLSGALQPAAAALLESQFGAAGLRLVPGGRAGPGRAPATLEPGSAVAVDVMRGDLQLAAIGTVTYRDGDRVLIFGHPFFQAGDVSLPMSTATITTIVASAQNSFKLGQRGVEVGVVTQDRRAAVAGRLGEFTRLLPITIEIVAEGQARRLFHFESIEDRALAPVLLSAATLNSVLESGGSGAGQTMHWSLDCYRKGSAPLRVSDVVSGDGPLADLAAGLSSPLRFLFGNPFERCRLDSVHARIVIEPRRAQWTLRTATLLESSVPPGGKVRARCEIESWRGERHALTMSLDVPEELPEGGYVLALGGGAELSRYESQRLPSRYRPTSLDEAWRRLGELRPSDALYGALFASAPEVTRRGDDYPELPMSALALLASGNTGGEAGRRGNAARLDERRLGIEGSLRGEVLLTLRVERIAR